eukprot:9410222-Pyramimonas_sp.AAC.1
MTRAIRIVCGPSSSSRPSSDLCMPQAEAPDVSELVSVITSLAAPLQPDLSTENRQHLSR